MTNEQIQEIINLLEKFAQSCDQCSKALDDNFDKFKGN